MQEEQRRASKSSRLAGPLNERMNFSVGNRVVPGRNRGDYENKWLEPQYVRHNNNDFISSANITLLDQFVDFCKAKNINLQEFNGLCPDKGKAVCEQGKVDGDSSSFRDALNTYFGDQLPAYVVEELCKLVHDNSHGKCHSCILPTEMLILNVLQILSDGGQLVSKLKENIPPPQVAHPNILTNANAKSFGSTGKVVVPNSVFNDLTNNCSQPQIRPSVEGLLNTSNWSRMHNQVRTLYGTNVHEMSCFPQGNCPFDESSSLAVEVCMNQRRREGDALRELSGFVHGRTLQPKTAAPPDLLGGTSLRDQCLHGGKLTEARVGANISLKDTICAQRFPVTNEEMGLYSVICGLPQS